MQTKVTIAETLQNLYKQRELIKRVLDGSYLKGGSFQTTSTFANDADFDVPLEISGRLISSGQFNSGEFDKIEIPAEGLKKTAPKWEGVNIYTHHGVFRALNKNKDVDIGNVVGEITQTQWNEEDKAIDFTAMIADEDIARKIFHGLIDSISVGFGRDPDTETKEDVAILKNISPKEASLVFDPRDSEATFRPSV